MSYILTSRITHLNLWSNSQCVSSTLIVISLNPNTDCESDLGLLNYLLKETLVSTSVSTGWLEQYLIYHVSVRSCKVVTNWAFFIFSLVICCAVHKTFATNQNWSVSSLPIPLKTGNIIVFSMLNGGGGGRDVDKIVCCGGGGGVGGWCIYRKPYLISWIALRDEAFIVPSSSLAGGRNKRLYSRPTFS